MCSSQPVSQTFLQQKKHGHFVTLCELWAKQKPPHLIAKKHTTCMEVCCTYCYVMTQNDDSLICICIFFCSSLLQNKKRKYVERDTRGRSQRKCDDDDDDDDDGK
jgi:hypothetical protein